MSRIFTTSFASVYPHYMTKVEKKGRTRAELDQVIGWLTGFDESTMSDHLDAGTTFEDFFTVARLNPHASLMRMSRVPWNFGGGPMIIRLRSRFHHDVRHRQSVRRHAAGGRLAALVGAGGR